MSTQVREVELLTTRHNPNVIAKSFVLVEHVTEPGQYQVFLVTTYLKRLPGVASGIDQSQLVTSVERHSVTNGRKSVSTASRAACHIDPRWNDGGIEQARANHDRAVRAAQDGVRNPAWRAAAAEHPLTFDTWSRKAAEEYNRSSRAN